jgi:flagellar biosynthesis/type III secretory pathway protein FliH
MSKDELEAQHKRKEFISIQRLAIKKADEDGFSKGMEKGMEKGLEQGLEKGLEKGILTVARNLLDILDNKTMSLKTGLDIMSIQKLRDR